MPDADIAALTARELIDHYRRKALSPVEVTRDALARIAACEPAINAFVRVEAESALAAAKASEARWARTEPAGRLDGLPATIKDNIDVAGVPSR
jgi:aspartyl-tRNA(Asn)/glutamyl-tRNA(Gln) amidotransferase subunit A